jgi:para-aminobenzoate synthetase/4-amino-4-deoxychorismate lyase
MTIVLHDAKADRWLRFSRPHLVVEALRPMDVLPALERTEDLVRLHGWHAAGILSYEAGPGLDPALCVREPRDFPLVCFGLFPEPEQIALPRADRRAYVLGTWRPSIGHLDYLAAIRRIKGHISRGETYQVNFTFRLRAEFSGQAWQLFLSMARAQNGCYSAWVDMGRYAVCSASPELFFRLQGTAIVSKPMKGTAERGRTLAEDETQASWLTSSEKNRAENLMIVDMIRNDLGRIAEVGSVKAPVMFQTERYPTLWQMTSTVCAESSAGLPGIMSALFPCASITGAPKVRTARIIAELENEPRGMYTGCIGYLSPRREAQFSVAIRTAVVDRQAGRVEYGVGGGVVWDSSEEDEYAECMLKTRVLDERPPDFSLLESLLWEPVNGFFLLEHHISRLRDSAVYFGYPLDMDQIKERLYDAVSSARERLKVRLLLGDDGGVQTQISVIEPGSKRPVRLKPAARPVDSTDVFLYHKTTNRGVHDDARASVSGCDDAILWNERGEVTEASTSNLVVRRGSRFFTPPVTCGLLAGTFRSALLCRGRLEERVIPLPELASYDGIFLINSVRKWRRAILA